MASMSGGKAVVESLRAEGVRHVFGLIGSAGMEIFDALYDARDIRFIGVRDERTGTHMADAYARASGRAGVIIAGQNGPGATNLVTGLAQACAAFSPVVALAGSLSSGHIYRDAFQEVDQQALFRPITKKTWTATQSVRLPEMVREAFRSQPLRPADWEALRRPEPERLFYFPAGSAGAELLNTTFRLAPSYESERTFHDDGHLTVVAKCRLTHAPSGIVLGGGEGLHLEVGAPAEGVGVELAEEPLVVDDHHPHGVPRAKRSRLTSPS